MNNNKKSEWMNKWTNIAGWYYEMKKINKNKIKFCDFKTPTWAPFSPAGPSLPGWPCKTKQNKDITTWLKLAKLFNLVNAVT